MKKYFYTLIFAAMTAVPVLAQNTTTAVATFENVDGVTLNSDSVYYGTDTDLANSYTYVSYGDTVTTFNCKFKQGPFTFTQSYTPKWYSWTGFAISACKDTTFTTFTLGQFHNVAGGAYEGDNYCVVYGSGDSISVDKGASVQGLYITNSAYSRHSFAFGDSYTKPFSDDSCFFKVTITGVKDDNSVVTKDVTLANYHDNAVDYINNWQWIDLSDFGEVKTLKFSFDGSDKGAWGLNTPAYVCIDNLTASVTNGIATVNGGNAHAVEVARYSLNGTLLSSPQKGVNIVKMSDGTTRKVIVK